MYEAFKMQEKRGLWYGAIKQVNASRIYVSHVLKMLYLDALTAFKIKFSTIIACIVSQCSWAVGRCSQK